jgi:apyrase
VRSQKGRKEQKHLHFKRNAKGQPLMRYRMEKLLSQIQKTAQ